MEATGQEQDPALVDRLRDYLFGHPLRARIVSEVRRDPRSPAELAEALDVPLPRVIYHFSVLIRHGGLADHG